MVEKKKEQGIPGRYFEHSAASWDDISGTNSLCDKKLVNGDLYSTEVVNEVSR